MGQISSEAPESLLGQQRRQQAVQRAAGLVELDRGGAPGRERAGRLAAGQPECVELSLGIQAEQPSSRGGPAERADHPGAWKPRPRKAA